MSPGYGGLEPGAKTSEGDPAPGDTSRPAVPIGHRSAAAARATEPTGRY